MTMYIKLYNIFIFLIIFEIFLILNGSLAQQTLNDKIILIQGHPFFDNSSFTALETRALYGLDKKIRNDENFYSQIHPGTNWCGRVNKNTDYNDLGKYHDTDKCCRDHYYCDNIPPRHEKYGLVNSYKYTRSHCQCDKNFFDCLHQINDTVSNSVGREYFLFSNSCYQKSYSKVDCIELKSLIFEQRCVEYAMDSNKKKTYQWFDLPYYYLEDLPDPSDPNNFDEFYRKFEMHLSPDKPMTES